MKLTLAVITYYFGQSLAFIEDGAKGINDADGQLTEKDDSESTSIKEWWLHIQRSFENPINMMKNHDDTFGEESISCVLPKDAVCSWGDCNSNGKGNASTASLGLTFGGIWNMRRLSGVGNITFQDNSLLKGTFMHGCLHGFAVMKEEDGTLVSGFFRNGQLTSGPIWLVLPSGEGALYSHYTQKDSIDMVDRLSRSLFTGEEVVWVYPDHKTALVGTFVAGSMLSAREAEVVDDGMEGGSLRLKIWQTGNKDITFSFDPSTETHLSSSPLKRDPYEKKLLDVQVSRIPNAGMGVFTKQHVQANTIIGYFNGVHRHRGEIFKDLQKSAYLVEGTHPNEMLDIPEEFRSWSDYKGSAGHLINHGREGNVDYIDCWHPRFGRVLCVESLKDIPEDTELLVQYDVAVDGDGLKMMLKTALHFGHAVSGKSKEQFANDARPYLKAVSELVKTVKMGDLIRF